MTMPPFDQWLQLRKEELLEEYREDCDHQEDLSYDDFKAWAKIQYENEVLLHEYKR